MPFSVYEENAVPHEGRNTYAELRSLILGGTVTACDRSCGENRHYHPYYLFEVNGEDSAYRVFGAADGHYDLRYNKWRADNDLPGDCKDIGWSRSRNVAVVRFCEGRLALKLYVGPDNTGAADMMGEGWRADGRNFVEYGGIPFDNAVPEAVVKGIEIAKRIARWDSLPE